MPMRILRLLVGVLAALAALAGVAPTTTAATAATFTYDGPTSARGDVGRISGSDAAETQLTAAREVSASPSVEARDASKTPRYVFVATNTADDFVDLASPARRTHILDGDATGGGHLWPGNPGKTPFPQGWSGDKIMHEVSDIATDPIAWQNAVPQGSRTVLTGTRGGVDIRVIVDTKTGEIISGYPTDLPRNP
jgi:hypothetical protein